LRVILTELDGVPHLGSDELKDARDRAITLELTNRFAHVRGKYIPQSFPPLLTSLRLLDPHAYEKALWVQAKRAVLAILRVQPAQNLIDSLMRPVSDDDEEAWEDILENEGENTRHITRRQPSAPGGDAAYRLEDIRS
jgi:Ras GTPase-activating-like protein IQGAP2/3